ncbi:tetratricopeptide repeat protein [Sphingobacterium psychroaquaticum]|uniref:type IX secretion system periplasmic lipoprotein PorW/SprE n=1 Tax=Sphingobacterium psychroaquaticum TaxID=561061 RepID=UPI00106CD352|nr:tetratricopeptide repeat protein [Sphingobacterium psychroaquaticum]QBQ42344.1 tetratricopeptide repeat protein [Sphingobacterium psychroaquaticum]
MIVNIKHRICKRLSIVPLLFVLLLFVASACGLFKGKSAAGKKSIDDTAKTDFFQNLTSKYNILYNSNLMLNAERKSIYSGANKNYQVRLTVFDEPTANGDPHKAMDSLIQKAYKIVNTKQESKYIQEAYYIIGRAYYLKGSYYTAIEFFDKLIKEAADAPSYRPLAYAWKSRSFLQIGKPEKALSAVDSAFMFLDESLKTRTFVNAAKANALIRVGKELEAIPFLEYAIESNKDPYDKNRWRFLLAQLYADNGQRDQAFGLFEKIAKANVPYDMSFEASLQAAFLTGAIRGGALVERVKPLKSMLKEGKNDGYKDQILFEIGRIYLAENDEAQAFSYFNKSLAEPNRNSYQTAETYLTYGDYLFQKKDYKHAQNYYDSLATALPSDYTDVDRVTRKLAYMSKLTALYENNLWQDTLISLGKLNENDRQEMVGKYAGASLIMKQKQLEQEAARNKKGKKEKGQQTGTFVNSNVLALNNTPTSAATSSFTGNKFYFNNQDAMLLGTSDFKRKWGNRQLKDDWRFSGDNTPSLVAQTGNVETASKVTTPKDTFDAVAFLAAEKSRFLDSVPTAQGDYDKRLKIVHDNMIVIGNIYRDYTKDNKDAIIAYESFLARFPNTAAGAEIYYSLYRMYDGVDAVKSAAYKDRLIQMYPNSLHAMVAKDPYYMDKINRDKRVLDRAFEKLFALYTAGDHVAVIKQANEELEGVFQRTGMVAQIEYLKALAIGRVGRVDDFTNALGKIVEKYPEDSLVVPLAMENIAFVEKNPSMFVNRVNALQDIDKSRIAFVDEPDMTPWPSLDINGDYRTGVAIIKPKPKEDVIAKVEEKPKVKEEKPKEEKPKTEEERKEIELLLAGEMTTKAKDIKTNIGGAKVDVNLQKKEETIVANLGTIEEEEQRLALALGQQKTGTGVNAGKGVNTNVKLDAKGVDVGEVKINYGPNEYRDKKLFPDKGTYFFTINVKDPRVNLAPSRYGIGQFNRSRYARAELNHQLKLVNAENQLLFIGPFESYEEVKTYESRILPLLPELMKIPVEDYNTFIITKEVIGTLTDGIMIKNYHQIYIEQ